jgi:hypothetical protein
MNDSKLFNSIKEFNELLGQSFITDWLQRMAKHSTKGNYYTGRLGFSAEPGGKTRTFAIGDY